MATTTWSCVSSAAVRLESIVHRTPVLESQSLNAIAGRSLFLKCEAMQKTGSFKARGALNAVLRLPKTTTGVVTHSAGNHGQALAWAAQQRPRLGCAVVVPNGTAKVKVDAIQGYGAELHFCEPTFEAREKTMHAIAAERGWSAIPPYNHDDVIAGQGTLAWEMCEQLEELHGYGKIQPAQDEDPFGLSILDAVIVPVSGGGMAAGVALAMKHLSPETKVFCVAPEGKGLEESLRSGKQPGTSGTSGTSGTRGSSSSGGGGGGSGSSSSSSSSSNSSGGSGVMPTTPLDTICDGMRTRPLGDLTFPVLHRLAEEGQVSRRVLEVSDEEVRAAMRLTMQRLKIVVEPSGATALAAALKLEEALGKAEARKLRRVGLIMCGGNADLDASSGVFI